MTVSKISKCDICGRFFDSKKDLKDHIDQNHRLKDHNMTVTSGHAERIVNDFLSSTDGVLVISIRDIKGRILAVNSKDSFKKTFTRVTELADKNYGGSLVIAFLGMANEIKDLFGEPRAIITITKDYKLMLLPMHAYEIVIGLVLEPWVTADDDKIATKIERLVADTLLK